MYKCLKVLMLIESHKSNNGAVASGTNINPYNAIDVEALIKGVTINKKQGDIIEKKEAFKYLLFAIANVHNNLCSLELTNTSRRATGDQKDKEAEFSLAISYEPTYMNKYVNLFALGSSDVSKESFYSVMLSLCKLMFKEPIHYMFMGEHDHLVDLQEMLAHTEFLSSVTISSENNRVITNTGDITVHGSNSIASKPRIAKSKKKVNNRAGTTSLPISDLLLSMTLADNAAKPGDHILVKDVDESNLLHIGELLLFIIVFYLLFLLCY